MYRDWIGFLLKYESTSYVRARRVHARCNFIQERFTARLPLATPRLAPPRVASRHVKNTFESCRFTTGL